MLPNLFMAMLKYELKGKCKKNVNLEWPIVFNRCIGDSFGSMEQSSVNVLLGLMN